MGAWLVRRIGAAVLSAWLVLTLAFFALRWLPGDALDATMARAGWSAEAIAARRAELGLDAPPAQQYVAYLGGVLRGDWGRSLISGQAVGAMIAQNARPTVTLALAALWVALALGVAWGVLAGAASWRALRYGAEALSTLALSTPVYWTATLAIYLFAVLLGWLPGTGGDGPRALILPALVLGFHAAGGIAQVTARSLREAWAEDFVRTARAKGLPPWDVLDHVLRVGLLPVIAVAALQLSFLLGGTVITETIFVRQGLGRVFLDAITDRDYPVVQGLVVLAALSVNLVHTLADVLYALVDPRVRREG